MPRAVLCVAALLLAAAFSSAAAAAQAIALSRDQLAGLDVLIGPQPPVGGTRGAVSSAAADAPAGQSASERPAVAPAADVAAPHAMARPSPGKLSIRIGPSTEITIVTADGHAIRNASIETHDGKIVIHIGSDSIAITAPDITAVSLER